MLAREIHAPIRNLWLNPECSLVRAEGMSVDPGLLSGGGVQREDRCWCLAVHQSVSDCDAIRSRSAALRRITLVLPLEPSRRQRERVHVRVEVLDVNDAVLHDRVRRQRAGPAYAGGRLPAQLERPGRLEPRHVGRRDRRAVGIPSVPEARVRVRPGPGRSRRRHRRSHRVCLAGGASRRMLTGAARGHEHGGPGQQGSVGLRVRSHLI